MAGNTLETPSYAEAARQLPWQQEQQLCHPSYAHGATARQVAFWSKVTILPPNAPKHPSVQRLQQSP